MTKYFFSPFDPQKRLIQKSHKYIKTPQSYKNIYNFGLNLKKKTKPDIILADVK